MNLFFNKKPPCSQYEPQDCNWYIDDEYKKSLFNPNYYTVQVKEPFICKNFSPRCHKCESCSKAREDKVLGKKQIFKSYSQYSDYVDYLQKKYKKIKGRIAVEDEVFDALYLKSKQEDEVVYQNSDGSLDSFQKIK